MLNIEETTLADFSVGVSVVCGRCGLELPKSATAEAFRKSLSSPAAYWIVARCPQCKTMTPVKVEATA